MALLVRLVTQTDYTALMSAADGGNLEVVQVLLAAGAHMDGKENCVSGEGYNGDILTALIIPSP